MPQMTSGTARTVGRCPYCGKPFQVRDISLPGHGPRLISLPCDCPQAKADIAAERHADMENARRVEFRRVWMRAGIPEEFMRVDADYRYIDALNAHKAVYLSGKTGRGKTHLACQLAKAYVISHIRTDIGSAWCDVSLLFLGADSIRSLLRSTWRTWGRSEEDLIGRWTGVSLLIFDDIGKGRQDEDSVELAFRIIRERCENHRETIFTSQYTTSALIERFSQADKNTTDALKSRLRGWCVGEMLDGPDRRELGQRHCQGVSADGLEGPVHAPTLSLGI